MANAEYNSGWADCEKEKAETHISITKVTNSFDKFFDKIKALKILLYGVYNHFKKSIDLAGQPMLSLEHSEQNLDLILNMIEEVISQDKKGGKNGNTKIEFTEE